MSRPEKPPGPKLAHEFTGIGWRYKEEVGCFAQCPKPHYENIAIGQVEITRPWRCERPKGHKDWHSCDNASWPP